MRVFLLASFPSLSLQEPAPLTLEQFLTRCDAHLPESEMEELERVCAMPPDGKSDFAKEWTQAWWEVRNFNDRARVKRLPAGTVEESPADLPYRFDRLRAQSTAAWDSANPLERERILLLAKWTWLEERRRAAPYSQADLLAYAIQLRLLEIRDAWDEEKGAGQFEEQTKTFMSPLLDQLFPKEIPA